MFCRLRHNVEAFCHKQDLLVRRRPSPAINKRRHLVLPAMSVNKLLPSGGTRFTTPDGRTLTTRDEAR